jgi:hypothetical protein
MVALRQRDGRPTRWPVADLANGMVFTVIASDLPPVCGIAVRLLGSQGAREARGRPPLGSAPRQLSSSMTFLGYRKDLLTVLKAV